MSNLVWLFLLLPVAAASGWLAARRKASGRRRGKAYPAVAPSYYKGLNYLLHDRPDQAIEVFIEMVHVDSETVETHLALGSLFRRRGEVDRAIRIHQNIIARPALTVAQRDQAFFELGTDYARAGFLDRAEEVMHNLLKSPTHRAFAQEHLLQIFQQQKEWQKAVETITTLIEDAPQNPDYPHLAAQFCCEMAEKSLENSQYSAVDQWLKKALKFSPDSVRASLIAARLAQWRGDDREALLKLQQVIIADPDYIPEVLPQIGACFQRLDDLAGYRAFLEQSLQHDSHLDWQLEYVQLLDQMGETQTALSILTRQLELNATRRGLYLLVKLNNQQCVERAEPIDPQLAFIEKMLESLVEKKLFYRCSHCGFEARQLHWRCPGCQQWDTFKPI